MICRSPISLRKRWWHALFAFVLAVFSAGLPATSTAFSAIASPSSIAYAASGPSDTSLSFEANDGQAAPLVKYMAHSQQGVFYFMPTEVGLVLKDQNSSADILTLRFVGANTSVTIKGVNPLPGMANYLTGDDESRWVHDVRTYARVSYRDLYQGIDLNYEGTSGQLKGTYVVAPGANPEGIRWRYDGGTMPSLDAGGNLHIIPVTANSSVTALTEKAPVAWQVIKGSRVKVDVGYVVDGSDNISFAVGAYDTSLPLIIDPTLSYSTYFGGSNSEAATRAAVDTAGNVYLTGETYSADFPTVNPFQPNFAGYSDVFIVKLDPSGQPVFSTYLGGSARDIGVGIRADSDGNVFLAGFTASTNFPVMNALQPSYGGGVYDAFVAEINAAGSALVYSTFLGGSASDQSFNMAIDGVDNVYLVGETTSPNFPLAYPFQPSIHGTDDAFVTKISSDGNNLVYSTYLGGQSADGGYGLSINSAGNAFVTGITYSNDFPTLNPTQPLLGGLNDAFITGFTTSGSGLLFSSFLGGTADDVGEGVAVDYSGNVYVTGYTSSTNFPTLNAYQPTNHGGYDFFLTKIDPTSHSVAYSTYLGGSADERATPELFDVAVDLQGNAYVVGGTSSYDYPIANAIQPAKAGGIDAAVTKFDAAGTALIYSTYLGGNGDDHAFDVVVDTSGGAYVVGYTQSTDFPTANPYQPDLAGPRDIFISKISDVPATPVPTLTPTNTWTPTVAPTFTPTSTPSVTPTATATPCGISFTDVHPSDYFYNAVTYLYCRGVISGYADNTFRPYNNTTRGQLTKIVVLAFGIPQYTPSTPTFRDVPPGYPFYGYIETAVHHDIISGYSCGSGCLEFRPGNNVTRGQLSKIVVIAAGWPLIDPTIPTFSDVPTDNAFYTYVETAYCHGVISGYSDGTFHPGNDATRGQISKIVYQAVTAGRACPSLSR